MSKFKFGGLAELTSEQFYKLGDQYLEQLHNFSCSEKFYHHKTGLSHWTFRWNIQYNYHILRLVIHSLSIYIKIQRGIQLVGAWWADALSKYAPFEFLIEGRKVKLKKSLKILLGNNTCFLRPPDLYTTET